MPLLQYEYSACVILLLRFYGAQSVLGEGGAPDSTRLDQIKIQTNRGERIAVKIKESKITQKLTGVKNHDWCRNKRFYLLLPFHLEFT